MWIQDHFSEFVLPPVAWRFQPAFYAKSSKMNCAFTSHGGLLFNCPSWIFYMLHYNSRALLRYNDSSKISCTKPWFFSSKFRKISLLTKVLKIGIFRRFLTEHKIHYICCNILPNSIYCNWDALLTCQRWTCFLQPPFFPRALKMVKFKGFRPSTILLGPAFHFLALFTKKKVLWKLWFWFSKMFHQRVFPDWKWSMCKFQFWRRILNICRWLVVRTGNCWPGTSGSNLLAVIKNWRELHFHNICWAEAKSLSQET